MNSEPTSPISTAPTSDSPFHEGERQIQKRLGVEDIDKWARQVVRSYLPPQHQTFYSAQPFLVAAARDEKGAPWATLLVGEEGFITSPDDRTLRIEANPVSGDPLSNAWTSNPDVGLLGIELETRRRNRVNGRVESHANALILSVDQTFGNCPQYIHPRVWKRTQLTSPAETTHHGHLTKSQRTTLEAADTFFIASGHRGEQARAHYGMDASHRGGQPGFVIVEDDRTLLFPDYSGNNHFNTLGNLSCDPSVGLLFVDFATGSLLQLTGQAEIIWHGPEVDRIPGAERLVRIRIDHVVENRNAIPLRWEEPSSAMRTLTLVEKRPESDDVTSFFFRSSDGVPLPTFEPGQYLPLAVPIEGEDRATERTYSLSNSPSEGLYRITVKREPKGLVSRTLHDDVEVETQFESGAPSGEFVLVDTADPIVFLSSGIGLTPLVAMLKAIAEKATRGEPTPKVTWIHGARDSAHHALAEEVRQAGALLPSFSQTTFFSQPKPTDQEGIDYDKKGRIGAEALDLIGADPSTRFYLCGPGPFMSLVVSELEGRGISPDRIHHESFGPSSVASDSARPDARVEAGDAVGD